MLLCRAAERVLVLTGIDACRGSRRDEQLTDQIVAAETDGPAPPVGSAGPTHAEPGSIWR